MIRCVLLAVLLGTCVTSTCFGSVIHVPSSAATIQAGVAVAAHGDTVLVAPGTYQGTGNRNIDFLGKRVSLVSSSGAAVTIIDCEGQDRGFHFHSQEDSLAVVDGFTITNGLAGYIGLGRGGGIYCEASSSPRISNCVITDCEASYNGGAVCAVQSSPIVSQSELRRNISSFGGAVAAIDGSSMTVRDCVIRVNEASASGGAISCTDGSSGIFHRCAVDSNYAEYSGGGLYCDESSPSVANVVFSMNIASSGGGAYFKHSSPQLDGVTLQANRSYLHGGGLYALLESSPVLHDCLFTENVAAADGGGFYVFCNTVFDLPVFSGCRFENNKAWDDGGGGFCWSSFVTIDGCEFADNEAVDSGGGLLSNTDAVCEITGSLFDGNTAGGLGGAVCSDVSGASIIENTTIVNNSASQGGGVFCSRTSTLHVESSIIAFSEAGGAAACAGSGDDVVFMRCCVFGNEGGNSLCGFYSDIIYDSPCLCGQPWRGDYDLCSDSPCLPGNNDWGVLLGAFEEGCNACCGPVHEISWGVIKAMYRQSERE